MRHTAGIAGNGHYGSFCTTSIPVPDTSVGAGPLLSPEVQVWVAACLRATILSFLSRFIYFRSPFLQFLTRENMHVFMFYPLS